jgi:hypothetical protein
MVTFRKISFSIIPMVHLIRELPLPQKLATRTLIYCTTGLKIMARAFMSG